MYFITIKRMLEVCFSAHPNIQYRAGNIFLWINRSFFYIKGVITHRKKKLLFFLEKYRFFLKKTLAFPGKLCYYNEAVA